MQGDFIGAFECYSVMSGEGKKGNERMARTGLVTLVHMVMGRVLSACLGVKGRGGG